VQLQQELGNISEKQAYDKAVEGSQSNVELQFLKAESWDGRKAAQRVVQFYEEQERLFGLARGVLRQSDLSRKENDCLGRVACLLEEPDKAGRRVLFTRLDELFQQEKLSVVGSSKILESVYYLFGWSQRVYFLLSFCLSPLVPSLLVQSCSSFSRCQRAEARTSQNILLWEQVPNGSLGL
jgi:hypothetical protein